MSSVIPVADVQTHLSRLMEATWKEKLLVAAIDFGTTFSGFAFSSRTDYEKDKTSALAHMWKSGDQPITHKTPTCLLLSPDHSFHSFGYDAERKYAELAEDESHKSWHFFRRFKMKLYNPSDRNTCNLSLSSKIQDTEGRDFSALTVFAYSIEYMKNTLVDVVKERFPGVTENDIYYILTTPAIWSEQAKFFMRSAARNAHIPSDHLRIALEPECAAVYVHTKELPTLDAMSNVNTVMRPGSCHLIVDLGGGTLDIAAHRVNADNQLEEIIPPEGGPWGSDRININFENFLISISGGPALSDFRNNMEDFIMMQRQFEQKKCAFMYVDDDSMVMMRIPSSFCKSHKTHNHEDLNESIGQMQCSENVHFKSDKMRMKAKLFRDFFKEPIEGVLKTVTEVLSKIPDEIQTIICVGGFSDCSLLKSALHATFPKKTIIIPEEAVTAIMKGAIIFGRDQSIVNKRVSRLTYGLDWNEEFDPTVHDPAKREEVDDGHMCRDIFLKLIGKGEEIPYNKPTQQIEAYVKSRYQTVIDFPFYRSEIKDSPRYIDDIGCHLMGTLSVKLMENKHNSLDRCVKLKVYFGATELMAEAEDNSGNTYQVTFYLEETEH